MCGSALIAHGLGRARVDRLGRLCVCEGLCSFQKALSLLGEDFPVWPLKVSSPFVNAPSLDSVRITKRVISSWNDLCVFVPQLVLGT